MKKLTLFIFTLLFFHTTAICQPCLPQGIIFTTQAHIDNFQTNNPDCTQIEGDVIISGDDITNLNGLDVLTSIWGYLSISNNDSLPDLSGLEDLIAIGGDLIISYNETLTSLMALENLNFIGGNLVIGSTYQPAMPPPVGGNHSLPNLMGLSGITSISGMVYIRANGALTSLSGLENLTSIGGSLSVKQEETLSDFNGLESLTTIGQSLVVYGNQALTSFSGLENLISIDGGLYVGTDDFMGEDGGNPSLASLTGLENVLSIGGEFWVKNNESLASLLALESIEPGSIDSLTIVDNSTLSACHAISICEYLHSPSPVIEIQNNAPGCNSPEEVVYACESCLPEGITFNTQEQIDSFQVNYPDCYAIEGNVKINGEDIVNLDSLNVLITIGGDLIIGDDESPWIYNLSLTSLSGLENLTSIAGSLQITRNDALTDLSGLANLIFIGGDLDIWGNYSLNSISGLSNLTSIPGDVILGHHGMWGFPGLGNPSLSSLSGFENITSIGGALAIRSNHSLSNLSGLDNLTSVGKLIVAVDTSLTSLHGLESLISIEEGLLIGEWFPWTGGGNPLLTSLEGLDNLSDVGGSSIIYGNESLTSLAGMDNLSSMSDLWIHANYSLTNLIGLENLSSIEGNLDITNNPSLIDLTGLENITSIAGKLWIANNDTLLNIEHLINVTSIELNLVIEHNLLLTGLWGLDSLDAGTIDELHIKDNASLSICHVHSVCEYLAAPNGSIDIEDNAPGCNSYVQVQDACDSIPQNIWDVSMEETFTLSPNPCSGSVNVRFTISDRGHVLLDLYEISGVRIKQLLNESRVPGTYEMEIDLSDIPAGVYFCVLETDPAHSGQTKKIIKLH